MIEILRPIYQQYTPSTNHQSLIPQDLFNLIQVGLIPSVHATCIGMIYWASILLIANEPMRQRA